jgi:SAM-dependent methyltransferase
LGRLSVSLSGLVLASSEEIKVVRRPVCPMCGSNGHAIYEGLSDQLFAVPGDWNLKECRSCDLLWIDSLPSNPADLYRNYYTHEENAWGLKEASIKSKLLSAAFAYRENFPVTWPQRFFYQALGRLRAMRDYAGGAVMWLEKIPGGKLLDIGSGSGEFLARMRDLGWQAEGREFDEGAVAFSRQRYSLNIMHGGLPAQELNSQEYDAVTLSHVIEHVVDPFTYFVEANRLLKVRGRLVIVTPNRHSLAHRLFKCDWRGLESPRHFHVFSENGLKEIANKAGFVIRELRTTSRTARHIFASSEQIRAKRLGLAPRKWVQVFAIPFQVIETLLNVFVDCGEEVLLIAEKRG